MNINSLLRLDRFTKEEWFDVARRVRPDLAWEEFERTWADFCARMAARDRQRVLQ